MKLKQPNPLNYFKVRNTQYLPRHFEVVSLPISYNMESSIEKWIFENLKNRYYVSREKTRTFGHNNIKVGFEDPKEASYFMLACPHLKYK
jgi:hypothetical protein